MMLANMGFSLLSYRGFLIYVYILLLRDSILSSAWQRAVRASVIDMVFSKR